MEVLWSKAVTKNFHSKPEGPLEGMGREERGRELGEETPALETAG